MAAGPGLGLGTLMPRVLKKIFPTSEHGKGERRAKLEDGSTWKLSMLYHSVAALVLGHLAGLVVAGAPGTGRGLRTPEFLRMGQLPSSPLPRTWLSQLTTWELLLFQGLWKSVLEKEKGTFLY